MEHRRDVSSGALCSGAAQRVCGGVERARGGAPLRVGPRDGAQDAALRRPPGYRRGQPARRPKLDAFTGVIDQILREDRPGFEEATAHGHADPSAYARSMASRAATRLSKPTCARQRLGGQHEKFVPLTHPPGDGAWPTIGEALVALIAGVEQKAHYLVVDLPHSDDGFVQAGRDDGGVRRAQRRGRLLRRPRAAAHRLRRTKLAVARICRGTARASGRRSSASSSRTTYSTLASDARHKGNDKGKVEGLVGYARRNFFVPVPRCASWDALNACLERQCNERRAGAGYAGTPRRYGPA